MLRCNASLARATGALILPVSRIMQKLLGVWDNYQCKRFLNRPIYPSDAWPEIGKILWYSFKGDYRAPRRYYFVAPRGVGTTLAGYLGQRVQIEERPD